MKTTIYTFTENSDNGILTEAFGTEAALNAHIDATLRELYGKDPIPADRQAAFQALYDGGTIDSYHWESHKIDIPPPREPNHGFAYDIAIRCEDCGSGDVKRDAWAEFDVTTQAWVLGDLYDNAFCECCEHDNLAEWLPEEADAWEAARIELTEKFGPDGINIPENETLQQITHNANAAAHARWVAEEEKRKAAMKKRAKRK